MKSLFRAPILINAMLFQITWFACVIGSAKGLFWPALLACSILAIYQLHPARRYYSDFKLVALSIIMGLIVDTIWIQSDLMVFTDPRPSSNVAPAWIILLWIAFALTINHSLAWLKAHPILPVVMGLLGGPLSYLAGLKLSAVEFHADTVQITVCLGLAWALSLVILVKASESGKQVMV